uniref:Uncharacterized protein n=1 Tax=Meloidogyne incognita TaxID=6306 RepID=A0A914MK73_MELIC
MKLSPMELMFRLQFCLVISQNVQDLLLLDVAPLSLGIETAVGVMTPVPRCVLQQQTLLVHMWLTTRKHQLLHIEKYCKVLLMSVGLQQIVDELQRREKLKMWQRCYCHI